MHTEEKPFSFGHCEKSFAHKGNLLKHLKTHTDEKTFSCHNCEKRLVDNYHCYDIREHILGRSHLNVIVVESLLQIKLIY